MAEITGTANPRTGTMPVITGTRWVVADADPVAHLPNLRKDARENAENVLHEIIADNTATIPEICARTGMALRTINNAIATLRDAGIIQSGDVKGGLKVGVKSGVKGKEVGGKGQKVGPKEQEVGPNCAEVGPKRQEVGPNCAEVGPKVDFDSLMPDARTDFKETCRQIWELLVQDETLLQIEVSDRLKIAHSTAKSAYAALMDAGLLIKKGEGRGSKWIVVRPSRSMVNDGVNDGLNDGVKSVSRT